MSERPAREFLWDLAGKRLAGEFVPDDRLEVVRTMALLEIAEELQALRAEVHLLVVNAEEVIGRG